MCCCTQEKGKCQKTKDMKGKQSDCSKEKVKKCHGKVKSHPCRSGRGHK